MRKLICIALAVISVSAFANGPILGAGATTCGKWVEGRKAGTYHLQLNWVLGFISSYNHYVDAYLGKGKNGVFGTADHNSVAVWMDNYCQKNPLESVYSGSVGLTEELKSRAR